MNYEFLLLDAPSELIIKEKRLKTYDGRIKGNRIAIRNDMSTSKKMCALAEELGHFYTTTGNILDQCNAHNIKQERKGRVWAYDKLIGLHGIIEAYESNCTSIYMMADYLNVTEEFLHEALDAYMQKYGVYACIENYIIYFIPNLMVTKMF